MPQHVRKSTEGSTGSGPRSLLDDVDLRLLTNRDVAAMCSVSTRTVEDWRARGTGPEYRRLGRVIRYDERDVRRWIESHRVVPGRS